MNLTKNTIIEWFSVEESKSPSKIERIIHVSSDGTKLFLINVFSKVGFPVPILAEDIISAYEEAELRIINTDPFAHLIQLTEEQIPDKHKEIRNKNWELINKLLEKAKLGIYDPAERGQIIKDLAEEYNKPDNFFYYGIRKYWQRGCIKNALLPDYFNCGNKGKQRLGKSELDPKLGRKDNSRGIRITPRIENLFKKATRRFYETREKHTFQQAYELMLDAYFYEKKDDIDGVPVVILLPPNQRPTIRQFYYWYCRYYRDFEREQKSRYGENKFDTVLREITGDSSSMAIGPGSLYIIDATIADVYLISSYYSKKLRIIGRPVVYLIIDVFSHMIVGFSVSLEGPSWLGATLALDCMITDKVALCAKYGITITKDEWDCRHLCEGLIADNGEFKGYNADTLVNAFGMKLYNSPVYRPDLKALVERAFGIANTSFVHFLPGSVIKDRERGEKPHALDAKLTLFDFRALLIIHILRYNSSHILTHYRRDEFMVDDDVPLTPISLWNWGINNRSGHLHTVSQDVFRLNLLPRKKVSVNRQGIHFYKDIYYQRPPEIPYGRGRKIEIAYDPAFIDQIYIPNADGSNAFVCPLTPASKLYRGRDWQETEDMLAIHREQLKDLQQPSLQANALFRARKKHIVSRAINNAASTDESNRSLLGGIRENRQIEKALERSDKKWLSADNPHSEKRLEEDEYIAKPSFLNLIKSVGEQSGNESNKELQNDRG